MRKMKFYISENIKLKIKKSKKKLNLVPEGDLIGLL